MLAEKIKINVTAHTYSVILKDAEAFEFFKKDGIGVNKNTLLSHLIVNYYQDFQEKQAALIAYLGDKISHNAHISKSNLLPLCLEIANHINKTEVAPNKEKFNCTLNFKPTKQTQPVLDYIEKYLLNGASVSEYFRNMFTSYASLPQDEREKIIFQPQFFALTEAIKNKQKVFLSTTNYYNNQMEISPYAIAESKEELHCYLLAGVKNDCRPIRLSRIVSVTPVNETSVFSNLQLKTFAKMQKYGPQFSYGKNEEEVMVQLTARGKEKFSKFYVHRPIPDKIVNNCYYFNCSHMQLIQYFIRFGKDAYIAYPENIRSEILRFHSEARKKYLQPKTEHPKQDALQTSFFPK